MIPDGYVSLQSAFTRLAAKEARDNGPRPDAGSEAAGRLLHRLVTGGLQTLRCDPKGAEVAVTADEWRGEAEVFNRKLMTDRAYSDVLCREADLQTMLGPPENAAAPAAERIDTTETRGRPAHDRDQLCIAVAIWAFGVGALPGQDKIIEDIQVIYNEMFGDGAAPGRTMLQPIVRAIIAENGKRDRT